VGRGITIKTSDFDYVLPPELIAQTPIEPRDNSRLLVVNRKNCSLEHHHFFEIVEFLNEGDVLVFNESRVVPARLIGSKSKTGGKVEILLLLHKGDGEWEALVKPGKRVKNGAVIEFSNSGVKLYAEVTGAKDSGVKILKFSDERLINNTGIIALPPYVRTQLENSERYQTVYAKNDGSVAAPTAGLHFTNDLLDKIKHKGVICVPVTVHIGLDTFQPVREENPQEHIIHREFGIMSEDTAFQINKARSEGRRIVCIGTTAVRIVEHIAHKNVPLKAFSGWIDLFILPGYQFRITDTLITNFHLPRTTLLMLVSAFTGKGLIDKAYAEAIKNKYRFYSFGDAMLVL
jgi:S-adenosylmethionine:tRNA ribosyltransferase-isomerase